MVYVDLSYLKPIFDQYFSANIHDAISNSSEDRIKIE